MKKMLTLVMACSIALLMCSCGSLNQRVGGRQLTPGNIAFAKDIIRTPNYAEMRMTWKGVSHYTDKWASDVMPTFPVIYWTTLGSFEEDKYFGVRKVSTFFPVFYVIRDSLYNAQGNREITGFEFNLAMVFGFENFDNYEGEGWKFGLLWIPGIGPFLGFGSSYFQFLWIPFTDID
jgi:glycerol uptake facilitator-like aquaporin